MERKVEVSNVMKYNYTFPDLTRSHYGSCLNKISTHQEKISTDDGQSRYTKADLVEQNTSPWGLGIIVTLAIFLSIISKIPVLSSDALINVPELLPRYD